MFKIPQPPQNKLAPGQFSKHFRPNLQISLNLPLTHSLLSTWFHNMKCILASAQSCVIDTDHVEVQTPCLTSFVTASATHILSMQIRKAQLNRDSHPNSKSMPNRLETWMNEWNTNLHSEWNMAGNYPMSPHTFGKFTTLVCHWPHLPNSISIPMAILRFTFDAPQVYLALLEQQAITTRISEFQSSHFHWQS